MSEKPEASEQCLLPVVNAHELFLLWRGICWWRVGFELFLNGESSLERRGESVAFEQRE